MSWIFKASRFTSIKGSSKFYQRLHIKLETAKQTSLEMVWLDVTQLIKTNSTTESIIKVALAKTCPRKRKTGNIESLQSVQDGHLKLRNTGLDHGNMKSVVREVNGKTLSVAILEGKGMMEFPPALLYLITSDFLENLSIDKWHVSDQLATVIYPAISDGQIMTLLYLC